MSDLVSELAKLQQSLQVLQLPDLPQASIPSLDTPARDVAALTSSLEECAGALDRIETSMTRLLEKPQKMLEELQAHGSHLHETARQLFDSVSEDLQQAGDTLAELGDKVPDSIREKWESLGDTVNDLQDDMLENAGELWRDAVNEATDEWQNDLQEVLDKQMERFTDAAEMVQDALEQALEALTEFAEVRLAETVKEEARKLLETALERLRQEVMDGGVTSQIQTQLTTAMSPYLPQLMAVRAVASAIKQALEILRMGF